jgi:hypothetical protein
MPPPILYAEEKTQQFVRPHVYFTTLFSHPYKSQVTNLTDDEVNHNYNTDGSFYFQGYFIEIYFLPHVIETSLNHYWKGKAFAPQRS